MQSYMDVGVSLLHFKYPVTLEKLYYKCNSINYIFLKANVYKQFLNEVAKNTKVVQGKTFIQTNNYDLYLIQSNEKAILSSLPRQIIQI